MKDADNKQETEKTVQQQITRGIQEETQGIQYKKMAKNEGRKIDGTTSLLRLRIGGKHSTCKSDTSFADIHSRG